MRTPEKPLSSSRAKTQFRRKVFPTPPGPYNSRFGRSTGDIPGHIVGKRPLPPAAAPPPGACCMLSPAHPKNGEILPIQPRHGAVLEHSQPQRLLETFATGGDVVGIARIPALFAAILFLQIILRQSQGRKPQPQLLLFPSPSRRIFSAACRRFSRSVWRIISRMASRAMAAPRVLSTPISGPRANTPAAVPPPPGDPVPEAGRIPPVAPQCVRLDPSSGPPVFFRLLPGQIGLRHFDIRVVLKVLIPIFTLLVIQRRILGALDCGRVPLSRGRC